MSHTIYHVPTRPYSPIDALNRRALATGSVTSAIRAQSADYNGHHVTVSWNSFRGYYIAQYWWAGRCPIARSTDAAVCIEAALSEYNRGALGASVAVVVNDCDADIGERFPQLVPGREPRDSAWRTWKHDMAVRCARDAANPGIPAYIFDWPLMDAAESEDSYCKALRAKYGRVFQ